MFGSVTYLAPPPTIIYTKVTPLTAEVNNRDGDAVNKSKRKKDTRVSFGLWFCTVQILDQFPIAFQSIFQSAGSQR